MIDEQIIKDLEHYLENMTWDSYLANSYFVRLVKNSFDLINRQKADIFVKKELLDRAIADIEEFKAINESLKADRPFLIANAKSEAIKEFAERLKKESFDGMNVITPEDVVFVDDIDNLVEEMVGAESG